MALSAYHGNRLIIAPQLSDDEWSRVVSLGKKRELSMPTTGLSAQAKTVRWRGGVTRFFSHFPGEAPDGYAGEESAEHEAMKFAAFGALQAAGIDAQLERGTSGWRADVLVGATDFAPALAIEIQLSRQSAELTYQRTAERSASGVPTLWIFGQGSSTGHLGSDLLSDTPVFTAKTPDEAADIALAVCQGQALFDDLSSLRKTPARPVACRVSCNCGAQWLRPQGVILLPNRIRGDLTPTYASAIMTKAKPKLNERSLTHEQALAKLCQFDAVFVAAARTYGLQLGTTAGRPFGGLVQTYFPGIGKCFLREFACPECFRVLEGHIPTPKQLDMKLCPVPVATEVDARHELQRALRLNPTWLIRPIAGVEEPTMSMAEWMRRFITPMKESIAQRLTVS